jgi:uncharacterized membrane protein
MLYAVLLTPFLISTGVFLVFSRGGYSKFFSFAMAVIVGPLLSLALASIYFTIVDTCDGIHTERCK